MLDPEKYEHVRYDLPSKGVARITLARAERRNAQGPQMTYEIDDAFRRAAQDDDVRVVIMAADGPDFSSGHDFSGEGQPFTAYENVTLAGGFSQPGQEGHWAFEEEVFLGMCWRWRNMPKPTIAQVQGKTIAGGLMLVWVNDIIVASEEATFADPVILYGVNGVEYFGHPWEVGVRRAKEMLFTGEPLSAHTAFRLGMVNHVVAREELESFTIDMAETIAKRPMMGLKLAKQSVNQAQDAQGFWTALQAAMSHQQLGHADAALKPEAGNNPETFAELKRVVKTSPRGSGA